MQITYRSCAKINLYLDVLNRRRDGFHNIETLFQTVSLADELTFTELPAGIEMECSNPSLECGTGNLVHRAAAMLAERCGCTKGVRVRLDKRIPVAAGLAGGSGNAAATLVALNRMWGLGLNAARIAECALRLGSDVPYCAIGGTMAATRRGEELSALDPLPETWFVLVHPEIQVSTAAVYNSPALRRNPAKPFAGKTASFRAAIRALDSGDIPGAMFNAMEKPVFAQHPELAVIQSDLLSAGCVAAAMSGSGPTMFGVCKSREHADAVAGGLAGLRCTVVKSVDHAIYAAE